MALELGDWVVRKLHLGVKPTPILRLLILPVCSGIVLEFAGTGAFGLYKYLWQQKILEKNSGHDGEERLEDSPLAARLRRRFGFRRFN